MDFEKVKKYGVYASAAGALLSGVAIVIFPPAAVGIAGVALAQAVAGYAAAAAAVGSTVGVAEELWLNRVRGKVVQIFGPKGVGKNSVYDAITQSDDGKPDATSESTKKIYEDNSRADLNILKGQPVPAGFFKDIYEVSGERVSKWKEVIEETNPHGIIYVVTSCTEYRKKGDEERKERFKLETDGLYEVCKTLRSLKSQNQSINIKTFLILVNKADLCPGDRDNVADEYKNELSKYYLPDEKESLFDFLKIVMGSKIPIRVQYFSADYDQRSSQPYKDHNSKVILEFWLDILK